MSTETLLTLIAVGAIFLAAMAVGSVALAVLSPIVEGLHAP